MCTRYSRLPKWASGSVRSPLEEHVQVADVWIIGVLLLCDGLVLCLPPVLTL
jgi:hypothetical protein